MKSIADKLPPEIARQIHPDRRKNEAGYWAARDQLLGKYGGEWIGFADAQRQRQYDAPAHALQHRIDAVADVREDFRHVPRGNGLQWPVSRSANVTPTSFPTHSVDFQSP